jgi:tetratricopeptide (TPR) repeat protein
MTIPNALETYNELIQKKASRPEIVYALQQLSDQWLTQKREKKAIECLDYAMQVLEDATLPEERGTLASLYHQVGHLWRQLGNHKLTGMYYKKALELYKDIHTSDPHYDNAASHFILASFLDQIWKLKPAQFHYERALAIMVQVKDKGSKEVAAIQEKLAAIKQKLLNRT